MTTLLVGEHEVEARPRLYRQKKPYREARGATAVGR
jgi:hypothetical protein